MWPWASHFVSASLCWEDLSPRCPDPAVGFLGENGAAGLESGGPWGCGLSRRMWAGGEAVCMGFSGLLPSSPLAVALQIQGGLPFVSWKLSPHDSAPPSQMSPLLACTGQVFLALNTSISNQEAA